MDKDKPPIRIGLIGVGNMGSNHFRVLQMLSAFKVVGVHDPALRSTEYQGVQVFQEMDELLQQVDAVSIASPSSMHKDHALRALDFVRFLFIEKPMAESLESSAEISSKASSKNAEIQVGFIERFNPAVIEMEKLLRSSPKVVSIDFTRTNKISARITDVDVILDLMIHDIDLALYLNGPVKKVSAFGKFKKGMVGFAVANLEHENGRFSRLQSSRMTERKIRDIKVTGEDFFIDCELLRKEIKLYRGSDTIEKPGEPYRIVGTEETIEVLPREALVLEFSRFADICNGGGREGAPGVAEAGAALQVCVAIQQALDADA